MINTGDAAGARAVVVKSPPNEVVALPESLVTYLDELCAETPVYRPDDRRVESAENTWHLAPLGFGDTDADVAVADRGMRQLAGCWLEKVWSAQPGAACTFYTWYDAQAGQLRLSLTSRAPTDLPLNGVQLQDSPAAILQLSRDDETPGMLSWGEFKDVDFDAPDEDDPENPFVLPVWAMSTYAADIAST